MNFNINKLFKREATDTSSASSASGASSGGNYGGHEVQVVSQSAALSVAAFYRAAELRANTMGQLVMEYQKKNDKTHGNNYEKDCRGAGKRLNYLLQVQPNPTMTWAQLVKQAELQRIFQGNAVIYIERDSWGEVSALWLCSSANLLSLGGDFKYNLQYNAFGGVIAKNGVDSIDVLHIRNTFSNDYGLTGVSTLRYAREALSLAATNDKLVKDTAAKGGKMKLLLQEEKTGTFGMGRANKKELEKATAKLQQDLYDNDVVLLSNIANVSPISQNLQQQEISTIRNFSVREIARFMGVPAILLMDDSNSSYKSPEAATQEFLLRTISPLGNDWEMEMNAKLLGVEGYPTHRFHFNEESLMRLDPTGRANIGKVLLETGVKCVNELRAEYDLPTVEGGDQHLISTNLQKLDDIKVGKNQAPTPQDNVEKGEGL